MNPDDLIRMIAESERRYAELAAAVRGTSDEIDAILTRHAEQNGLAEWQKRFAVPTQKMLAAHDQSSIIQPPPAIG